MYTFCYTREGYTFGRIYVPCIYSHATWDLPLGIQVFAVGVVWCHSSAS